LYKWQLFKTSQRFYLDKNHPNIWLAEKLKTKLNKSLFIGIERNPYATVASMMKHEEVSEWHKRWREFPIPNRFLGINSELEENYDSIPLASQCAMRWLSHHNKMNALSITLGRDLLVISYESFVRNPKKIINRLRNFLELEIPIAIPEVKMESLYKWERQLSIQEVGQIQYIVGFSPE
jgi:hypothetical protein